MSKRANTRLIGLFVLGALTLLVAALVIFGGGRLFARTDSFVMFFEDDVAGLQVGAPVTFRGVRIGSVTDIRIRYDADNRQVLIPVIVNLERRQAVLDGRAGWEPIGELIQRGLRAQLKMQSIVTGQLAVELDFEPAAPLRMVGALPSYAEIPTRRSSISQIRATVSDLIAELRELPIDKLVEQFTVMADNTGRLLTHVDALVIDINRHANESLAEVPQLVSDVRRLTATINAAAAGMAEVTRNLGETVPRMSQGTLVAIDKLNRTLEQAQSAMSSVQDSLGDRSPLQFQMSQALSEITAAAGAMRVLAEYLQENPGVLLSGKGAPARCSAVGRWDYRGCMLRRSCCWRCWRDASRSAARRSRRAFMFCPPPRRAPRCRPTGRRC